MTHRRLAATAAEKEIGAGDWRPRKMLMSVKAERILGPVMVVMSSEDTVGDLVRSALEIYAAEKRRPFLTEADPKRFELHYSPFSLESLEEDEKLGNLESRNFFMCTKKDLKSSCSDEAKKEVNNNNNNNNSSSSFAWTKLMDFLL